MASDLNELRRIPRTLTLRESRVAGTIGGEALPPTIAVIHDLSAIGVGFCSAMRLRTGDEVLLTLALDAGPTSAVRYRVVHTQELATGWWSIGAEMLCVRGDDGQYPRPECRQNPCNGACQSAAKCAA